VTAAATLIQTLRARGITLEPRGDKLSVAPASAVTPEEVQALQRLKPEVLAVLRQTRAPSLVLDPETVAEVLGRHPDPHDLGILRLDIMTVVREIEQEIHSGTITSGVRLVRGRPLAQWLGMEQLAQLMGAWDARTRRRA
jgi:hypothetical protein